MRRRIGHLSDSHFDERGRLDDVIAVHRAFVDAARAAEVDLIVHTGDLYHRASTPVERAAVADFVTAAATVAPVVIVKGNHDQPKDLELLARLDTHFDVLVMEGAGHSGMFTDGFQILAMPWFDKGTFAASLTLETDAEGARLEAMDVARQLLAHFRILAAEAKDANRIPILASHALVAGSEVATGQTLQGIGVEFTPHDLKETGAEYVALGHVHMRQVWFDGRVAYAGSPCAHNFGEPEQKGWNLVTFDERGNFARNTFQPLPSRPMVFVRLDYRTEPLCSEAQALRFRHGAVEGAKNAIVRIRYETTPELLPRVGEAALEEWLLEEGAYQVKVEAVIVAPTRARVMAVAAALVSTYQDKLAVYLESKGMADEGGRLRAKLGEIGG